MASLPLSEPGAQAASVHWAPTLGRPCDLVAAAHGTSVDVFSISGDTSALQVGEGRVAHRAGQGGRRAVQTGQGAPAALLGSANAHTPHGKMHGSYHTGCGLVYHTTCVGHVPSPLPVSPQVELLTSLEHGGSAVRKVEFNTLGTCLAASTAGNLVHLWKPDFVGRWLLVSAIQGSPDAAEEGS